MASRPPRSSPAAERILASGLHLSYPPVGGPVTDPIDMDQLFVVDPELGRQVTALQLECRAQMHRNMADLANKTAELIKSRR